MNRWLVVGVVGALFAGDPCVAWTATAAAQDAMADEQARAHFNTGSVAFSAGRFADALDEFKKSYALSHRPVLLYNVGVAADRLRRDQEALEAFDQYLREVPQAPERAEVEARIVVLRGAVDQTNDTSTITTAAPVQVPASTAEVREPVPAATDRESHPSVGQWIVLGGSGVVAVTGGVLLGLALSDKRAVESPDDGVTLDELEGPRDNVALFSALGGTLLGVGLVGVGISTLWIVTNGDSEEPAVRAQVGLGSVSLRGTF